MGQVEHFAVPFSQLLISQFLFLTIVNLIERLIIFTRYPEAGKAKTRLIPALGTEGAAMLYRKMAEHTLAQIQPLQKQRAIDIEVRFTGGSQEQMQRWLGNHLRYVPQGEGDLGDRMQRSLEEAFHVGIQRTVIIGTDCPELNTVLLEKAFQALHQHDLVIGPAIDGGYYLIGQRHFIPDVFSNIPWSTPEVFPLTLKMAEALGVKVTCLPMLSDVDYPDDLPIWEQANQAIS